jgi:outer membrane protein assembly factor BamA
VVFDAHERPLAGRLIRVTWWLMLACIAACCACASIPRGRYGVDELEIEGTEDLDEFALRACLATKEREWLSINLSKSPSPTCGSEPFDARRLHLALWRWPWTDWPLYDPGVFERDVARVERWYKARGYYGARVLEVESQPEDALYGAQVGEINQIQLLLRLEEGEPVRISSVAIDGIDSLEEDVGLSVLDQLNELEPSERFDEAVYDRIKEKLLRTLRDAGYAQAHVTGEVEIDPKQYTAAIRYRAQPGPFSELGDICVEGHETLPAKLILQASDLRPGEPYSEQELEDARTRIYQMRVFSEVEIITGRVDPKTGATQFQDEDLQREGEWLAFGDGSGKDQTTVHDVEDGRPSDRVCRISQRDTARPKVPVEIRVKPGKLYRFGVGTGIQTGVEDGQRAYTAAQQWDVHVFAYLELRNFLGGLRRFRIEERPKLVFLAPFPRSANNEGERGFELGNNLSMLLEWPAFLENRTLLRFTSAWDRGPDPFGGGFIRDDIDIGLGPARDFLRNRLHASAAVHINPYVPHANGDPAIAAERYDLLFLRQILEWDERDDRTSPTRGTYARVEIHETLPPSSWGYIRIIPELRRYRPLPYGLVLATRAGLGILQIYKSEAKTEELRRLGPRPYRLRGGGAYSVRGVQAGQLGLRDSDLELGRNGLPKGFPGGTRSWIASVELRVPLGDSFGIAGFVDLGDVDAGSQNGDGTFRFDHPNTTLGGGLRYKTIVGPVRLDLGWLVPGLQGNTTDSALTNKRDPLFKLNGAVHLTIGEAF